MPRRTSFLGRSGVMVLVFSLVVSAIFMTAAAPVARAQTTGLVTHLTGSYGSTGASCTATSFTITMNADGGMNEAIDRAVVVPIVIHKNRNGGADSPLVSTVASTPTAMTFIPVDLSPTMPVDADNSFPITNGDVRIQLYYALMPDSYPTGTFTITITAAGVCRGLGSAYVVTRLLDTSLASSFSAINNSGNPQFVNLVGGATTGLILNVVGFDGTQSALLPNNPSQGEVVPLCSTTPTGCAINDTWDGVTPPSPIGANSFYSFGTNVPDGCVSGLRNADFGSYLTYAPTATQTVGFDVGAAAQWIQLRMRLQPKTLNSVGFVSSAADRYTAADGKSAGTMVRWRTGLETNNAGFNVYREDASGTRTRVNAGLVAGSTLFVKEPLSSGYSYSVWDPNGSDSSTYWIEDVELNRRKTMHGPIRANFKAGVPPVASTSRMLGKGATASGSSSYVYTADLVAPVLQTRGAGTVASKSPKGSGSAGWSVASQTSIKMSVREAGVYRVGQSQLLAAGFDVTKFDPRMLQVHADGTEQAVRVVGGDDGRFDASDYVEFFGTGADTSTTDTRVYWLSAGTSAGKRMKLVDARASTGSAISYPAVVELKDRFVYFAKLNNGDKENFFGEPVLEAVDQVLNIRSVDTTGANAILDVALQGVTSGSHVVDIALNGQFVGTAQFSGVENRSVRLSVPGDLVVEGANTITLTPTGGEYDFSLVDHIRLTYSHLPVADEGVALIPTNGSRIPVTIGGFGNPAIRIVDVSGGTTSEYVGTVKTVGTVSSVSLQLPAGATRRLYAFTPDRVRTPDSIELNTPSSWSSATNSADILLVTHHSFAAEAAVLKQHRESQGYRVALVDVQDVYDEFAFGSHSPYALRSFVSRAKSAWRNAPQYVVLVGDASLDPRDYFEVGSSDFVPTKLVDTTNFESASDDWIVDVNGDELGDLAIGRYPARTAEEAATMIGKVIGYEVNGAANPTALFVADLPDTASFAENATNLSHLLPAPYASQIIARAELGDSVARSAVLSSLDSGPGFVCYTGHGSVDSWRGNLLQASDAASFGNSSKLSFYSMANCLNGYFMDPFLESIGESLFKSPQGGAVAVWASSGVSYADGQQRLNAAFMQELFGGSNPTIGQAAMRAKAFAPRDIRLSWILIGDPVTRLK